MFYDIPVCYGSSIRLSPDSSSVRLPREQLIPRTYDTYMMRPATGDMMETACPVVSNPSAAPFNITLEADDGFRRDSNYIMVLALPAIRDSGAYAFLTASITDNNGRQFLPESTVAIGPDEFFPWTAEGSTAAPAPTFSDTTVSSSCMCTNTCRTASDNDCDGPHPTTEPWDNAQCALTSDNLTLTEPHGSLAIQSLRRRRRRLRVFGVRSRHRLC